MDREMMKKKVREVKGKRKTKKKKRRRSRWKKRSRAGAKRSLVAGEITFCNSTVRRRILIPIINLRGSPLRADLFGSSRRWTAPRSSSNDVESLTVILESTEWSLLSLDREKFGADIAFDVRRTAR